MVGQDIGYYDLKNILETAPGVWYSTDRMGDKIYHIKSEKSQHIIEMVKKQKMSRRYPTGTGGWKRKRENSVTGYNEKKPKQR